MDERGLGLRIGQARRKAGMTQQQLCQKTGLSYSTLAKIERGAIKSPSVFTVSQIAEAVGEPINAIIGASGNEPQKPAKKRSKSGVEFVYFDINGCLVRFFHQAFSKIAEDTHMPPDVVETTFWHYNDAACRGEMSISEFNRKLAKRLGTKTFDWAEYYLAAVETVPETIQLLKWAGEHYKIGLLSNIMPGLIDGLMEKGLIPRGHYDAVVDSSEVNAIKPEEKMYEIATKKAVVPKDAILLIDDSRTNLMAAERFGWKVLWFDDYNPAESVKRIKRTLEF